MDLMAQVLQKRNGLVFGKSNTEAFTLVELLIVILIIGLMGSVLAPRLAPRTARQEKDAFIASLNSLARIALTQAVTTQKLHQIFWDLEQRTIEIRKHTGEYDKAGDPECKLVLIPYGTQSVHIPERFIIKQFSIEGINELAGNRKTKQVWFYIVPDGIAQHVSIVMIDTHEDVDEVNKKVTLELNPFTVRYEEVR